MMTTYAAPPMYEILERLRWANCPITLRDLFDGFKPTWAKDQLGELLDRRLVARYIRGTQILWYLTSRGVQLTDPWANYMFPDRPGYFDGRVVYPPVPQLS